MRITIVSDTNLVNSNYRAYQPLQVLSRRGHRVAYNRPGEPAFTAAGLLRSDAVLVHRFLDADLTVAVEQAHTAGVGIVWDNDDDILAIPRSNPNYRGQGGPANNARVRTAMRHMLRVADIVTTPSDRLAAQYREFGAHDVRVLENYLPPEFERVKPTKHTGVVIAWLAGLEHQVDYQQLRLKQTFERLLDAHEDLHVLSIGLGLGLPATRYEHLPQVDFLDLARVLSNADVGIAPLSDNPWNQARSNIKLKEYASAGLTWLASPVGPYLGMGEKHGGQLVQDNDWDWALGALICDERRRRKLSRNAIKWAKGQSIAKHAVRWEQALGDAAERARGMAYPPVSSP